MDGRTASTDSDDQRRELRRLVHTAGDQTRSLAERAVSASAAAHDLVAASRRARAARGHLAVEGVATEESLVTLPNTWTRDLRSSLNRQALLTEAVGFLRAGSRVRPEAGTAGAGDIAAFLHDWDLAGDGPRPADS